MDVGVASPTGASSDLYRGRRDELRARGRVPGAARAILALGSDMCLDAVSRPDAFAGLWSKLRAGYLLDALVGLDGKPTPPDVLSTFLDSIGSAERSRQASARLGEDVRLRSERVIGSGLESDGELIQLSAFRSKDGGRRAFGVIARPSARR
jgi:hypothetical protein